MGWCSNDHPEHEGYLIGLVKPKDGWRYRDLNEGDGQVDRVAYVQVGCDCGWRSPRIYAPVGTKFIPSVVLAEPAFDDLAVELWKEHVAATAARVGFKFWPSADAIAPYEALAPLRKAHFERQVEAAVEQRRRERRAG
ncbi:MAG TPA: hypothetical protein VJN18_32500 [Polyangiaceae bacterium]|nr:hypothetical protein [Polyangiaceae bacterium]